VITVNATNSTLNCTYGSFNGSCVSPLHNSSSVKLMIGRILASYGYTNSSLSLLPYLSVFQNSSAAYLPTTKEWLVTVPTINPTTGNTFYTSFLLYDSNLSLVTPYIQTLRTSSVVNNYVVSQGVVRLSGKFACLQQHPLQVYWFMDPYAPGSISGLSNLTAIQAEYKGGVNATLKIVFGPYTQALGAVYGSNNAQLLGRYIFCAANQYNFSRFVSNLNSVYSNAYVSPSLLLQIANQSRLNVPMLSSCILNSSSAINGQALLAQYYNITTTPMVVTNCMYLSIPQTANEAVCYSNSTLCGASAPRQT
jgi:hypothetical protein